MIALWSLIQSADACGNEFHQAEASMAGAMAVMAVSGVAGATALLGVAVGAMWWRRRKAGLPVA